MTILDAVFVYQLHEQNQLIWHQRKHHHESDCVEIHYFLSGSGIFINGDRKTTISAGQLYVTEGSTVHQIIADRENTITYYAILLRYDEQDEDFLLKMQRMSPWNIGTNNRFFFEGCRDKGMGKNKEQVLAVSHQLIGFLYSISSSSDTHTDMGENAAIEKSLRFMQSNIFRRITLEEIAECVNLSRSYFVRLFSKKMHHPPMQYFNNLQMEAARSMLATSDLSIKEIAAKLNFCSEFHFSKKFKDTAGIPPIEYRKTHLQLIGNSTASEQTDV